MRIYIYAYARLLVIIIQHAYISIVLYAHTRKVLYHMGYYYSGYNLSAALRAVVAIASSHASSLLHQPATERHILV